MSKLTVTNFSKRNASPFQQKSAPNIQQEVVIQKTNYDLQKEKQSELQDKVNKKTAEIQLNKNPDDGGCFTEVVSHGAFQSSKGKSPEKSVSPKPPNGNSSNSKLMGFPSSANDLALEAKSDLESDKNISEEVKEKVIRKLFGLVAMVQHTYESKVRIMSEFEKFKDKYFKEELRREHEYSEQLFKLNMNFQTQVVESLQHLKTELDISRNVSRVIDRCNSVVLDGGEDTVDEYCSESTNVQTKECND